MSLFKAAFLELKGRKVKTFILFLIFTLLFTGMLTALTLLYSTENTKATVLENIGATVTLNYAKISSSDRPIFTADIRERLSTVKNVIGVNQSFADFAQPLNFGNSKLYEGKNPYSQNVQIRYDEGFEDNVVLEGNINAEFTDAFRNGAATLIAGTYPTEQNRGALISQILADQNGLNINSEINLSVYGNAVSLPVVGIYETTAHFQITSDNLIGAAVFAHSPYNRIYIDMMSLSEFYGYDSATMPIVVYINSPSNVQAVGQDIKSLDFDWDVFQILNTTDSNYTMSANNIESVSHIAKLFLGLLTAFSVIVLILVMSIWADKARYESGIFLSLGASKWRTVLLLIVSSFYVAIPSLLIAILSSKPFATIALDFQMSMANGRSDTVHQFTTGLEMNTGISIVQPNLALYIVYLILIVSVIVIACLLPMCAVLKLKPREILAGK